MSVNVGWGGSKQRQRKIEIGNHKPYFPHPVFLQFPSFSPPPSFSLLSGRHCCCHVMLIVVVAAVAVMVVVVAAVAVAVAVAVGRGREPKGRGSGRV